MNKYYLENFKIKLKNHNYLWKFKLFVVLPICLILVLSDWFIKLLVANNMKLGETKSLIPGFLNLHYKINLGSAYGQNSDPSKLPFTISIAAIITFIIIIVFIFINDKKWLVTISFILSGSLANIIARSWAPPIDGVYGGVVDMFVWDFDFFGSSGYIFNLADFWVNLGIFTGVITLIIEIVNMFKNKNIEKEEDINETKN